MNEDRMKILEMLSEGKIKADEAEKLIAALEKSYEPVVKMQTIDADVPADPMGDKYLYVIVQPRDESLEGRNSEKVSVKIPLAILKAGINIAALMPKDTRETIDSSLKEKGVDFNLNDIDPKNIEEFLKAIENLSIDVENDTSYIKVFVR